MELITKQLERELKQFPLYSQDGKGRKAKVLAKFFCGGFTWYVLEYDGKDTFFGIVIGLESEYGYFSLRELQHVKNKWGLGVERDIYFKPDTLENAAKTEYYLEEFIKNFD